MSKAGPRRVRTLSHQARALEREERELIVLWRAPITTLHYSAREFLITITEWAKGVLEHKLIFGIISFLICAIVAAHHRSSSRRPLRRK